MTASPKLALQRAAYQALNGSAFQTACGVAVGVWDHIPAGAKTPYVVIGDIQTDGFGAQGFTGSELHANWTVWSSKPGKVEVEEIAHQLRVFLGPEFGATLTLVDHRLVTFSYQQTIPMDDPDGTSVKAVVKIQYLTEPLT